MKKVLLLLVLSFSFSFIFAQKNVHGKIHDPRKSGKSVEACRIFLCEQKLHIK